ncbi:MAG: hypothetical protein PF486_12355 [Prolixibacteraceae bacterium]|jgi:hypothetical protein|nr:hypothetical protein [Prolixibacteraceae bacterium]
MKRVTFILALVLTSIVSFASYASVNSLQGDSNTSFGKYKITASDQYVVIDNVAYQTWKLNYEKSSEEYCVFYAPGIEGQCCFIVRCAEEFEVQYSKDKNGFGVRMVDPEKRTMNKKEAMKEINFEKFSKQMVLTTKNKTVEEYLGLLACYMPQLIES